MVSSIRKSHKKKKRRVQVAGNDQSPESDAAEGRSSASVSSALPVSLPDGMDHLENLHVTIMTDPELGSTERTRNRRCRKRGGSVPSADSAPPLEAGVIDDMAPTKLSTKKRRTSASARAEPAREKQDEQEQEVAPAVAVPPAQEELPTEEAVAALQEVSISNAGVDFQPWLRFDDVRKAHVKLRLPLITLSYMEKFKGFPAPTSIQAHCWPLALGGRDLIGVSKTGSGKTLAYLLPCFARVLAIKNGPSSFGPYALFLAPTRELAQQIVKEAMVFRKGLGINSVCLYGGSSKGAQVASLDRAPTDLIVATAGRLNDFTQHVDKFTGRTILSLSMVSYVVLDEADKMLDLGFGPQIRTILGNVAQERQTLLFSATWPNTVRALADEILQSPVHVSVGTGKDGTMFNHEDGTELNAAGNVDVEQRIVLIQAGQRGEADRYKKKEELQRILWEHEGEMCLVFCSMKKTAAVLAHQLQEAGFKSKGIHGNLTQDQRDEALLHFKDGRARVLVATDVAARGLDVIGIAVVVNYDPCSPDDHVHRVGRTGRAGKKGLAYTLLGQEDVREARDVVEVLKSACQRVPAELVELAARKLDNAKTRKCDKLRAKRKTKRSAA